MLDLKMDKFLQGLVKIENEEEKIIAGLHGFFRFFPFTRLSLFTYSPINFIGESLMFLNSEGPPFLSKEIREDVRTIPPIYEAIRNKRAEYVVFQKNRNLIPVKYIKKYELTSLLVVPLWIGPMVLGCVLIDRYNGKEPMNEALIYSIEEYFSLLVSTIAISRSQEEATKLSKREVEVLEQLSNGWSTKEMAVIMGISEFTARDYISSAMRKLGVKHRAQAIAEAMRVGLIS